MFKDNIWGVNLADMQLISKLNKGIRFLLFVINIYSKYAWIVPLKDKKQVTIACVTIVTIVKRVTIVNAFQKI